jgi:hypothetical protein
VTSNNQIAVFLLAMYRRVYFTKYKARRQHLFTYLRNENYSPRKQRLPLKKASQFDRMSQGGALPRPRAVLSDGGNNQNNRSSQ